VSVEIDALRAEVAALRAELAALRDGTGELHVARIVLAGDGEKGTTIQPGYVGLRDEAAGTGMSIYAGGDSGAGICAWGDPNWETWVELTAHRYWGYGPDYESPGAELKIDGEQTRLAINDVELPVPQPA
jgi:hypothetical protein